MKHTFVYGVAVTPTQEMRFSKYLSNNNLPAPNTISLEKRKQQLLDWLETEGKN